MGWRLIALWALVLPCGAQIQAPVGTELQLMASHAAVIFSGQVVAVSRNDSAGFVDVRFRIDAPVRGCPKTGWYVLREWAGLWTAQPERYRVGQSRLMLLTARGPAGMSSPVGGMDGAIPLVAAGAAPIADAAGVAPVDTGQDASAAMVDLRWIQARTVQGSGGLASARVTAYGGPVKPWPASGRTSISLPDVLSLLRGPAARFVGEADDARY